MELHSQFLDFFAEKGLLHIGNLEDLSGNIGIEGESWLKSLLPSDIKSNLLGSVTMSLRPSILASLKPFQSFGLTPVLVFPGIPLQLSPRTSLAKLWNTFAESSSIPEQHSEHPQVKEEIYYSIHDIVKIAKGEVLRAPFLSAPQLAYMCKAHLLTNVMGRADLVFYEVPVVIVEVLQTRYKYLVSKEVVENLGITYSELQQVFIMKGYLNKTLTDLPIASIFDTLRYVRAETILQNESDREYLRKSMKILDCRISLGCIPPQLNYTPNESVKEYGMRLPKEILYSMSLLTISPSLLSTIALSRQEELLPTADSNNYRRVLRSLKEIKSQTLSLMANTLDPGYFNLPIKIHYWYSEIFDILPIKPFSCPNWNIEVLSLTSSLKQQKRSSPDLHFCLKWHYDDYGDSKSLLSVKQASCEPEPLCAQALVNLNFLALIGYISPQGKPMLFGKSFMQCEPEWQNSTLYLQELLKMGVLNGRTLCQDQCSGISQENFEKLCGMSTDDSSRHAIVLISRVFSLVQPTLNEEVWTGEIDYDLAQFHSLLNAIFTSYQQAYEALVLKQFLSGKQLNQHFVEIAKKSPMLPYPHPALGIAIKKLLLYDDINLVTAEVPQIADIFLDLHRGWNFWNNFVRIMNIFKLHGAVPETSFMNEILMATKKLKTALLRARIHVA